MSTGISCAAAFRTAVYTSVLRDFNSSAVDRSLAIDVPSSQFSFAGQQSPQERKGVAAAAGEQHEARAGGGQLSAASRARRVWVPRA
eukprot:COSAG06_NODE_1850_length_8215_cov_51.160917_11_plen_87_part_00